MTAAFQPTSAQYVYIGAEVPFNNLWLEIATVATASGAVDIELWYGNEWTAAVDIVDETSNGTNSLTSSGRIQWNVDRLKGWDREQDSNDVSGLPTGLNIYDMYWLRMSWADNVTACVMKYIGQKFSDDSQLYKEWPDLDKSTLRGSFATGKTDWKDQAFSAADAIVRDLMAQGQIVHRGSILDYSVFIEASIHKTAEIVYKGLGSAFEDLRAVAHSYYRDAMKRGYLRLDANRDGKLSVAEKRTAQVFLSR